MWEATLFQLRGRYAVIPQIDLSEPPRVHGSVTQWSEKWNTSITDEIGKYESRHDCSPTDFDLLQRLELGAAFC